MDRLVWQTTKAQLYLTERAYVKRIVGRDLIQRNKVALRELRCLQEILSDLHSSTRSISPSRLSAIEAAASSWHDLHELSAARGVAPEALCDVPPVVRSFFQARHATSVEQWVHCESETGATSTRAPSTALELDEVRSLGTDCHFEHMAHTDGCVTCPSSRTASEQLDHLANELREQLDQEHTSLLASIEEVQGLMEAEVIAPRTLPSIGDLSLFVVSVEQMRKKSVNAGMCQLNGVPATALSVCSKRGESTPDLASDQVCDVQRSNVVVAPGRLLSVEDPRPRWADLSDSDREEVTTTRLFCVPGAPDEAPPTDLQRTTLHRSAEVQCHGSCEAARAPCEACGAQLVRSAFSRRAWRRARSGVATGTCEDAEAESGKCLACARNR